MSNAPSLRARLATAAADLHPETPVRLLAKRRAPLTRDGKALGQLEALLRITFRSDDDARGVLVFDWPHAANQHSAIAPLVAWSERCNGSPVAIGSLEIERRPTEDDGTHFKVSFRLVDIPDELESLLALATRLGLEDALTAPLEQARAEHAARAAQLAAEAEAQAAAEAAAAAEAEAAAAAEVTPEAEVEAQPEVDLEVERVAEPQPEPEPEPQAAAAPTAPARPQVSPEVQAQIDAIAHNDVFDPSRHPAVGINDEVTTSTGETFRLVQKRRGNGRKRVWTRVAQSLAIAGRR